MTSLFDFSVTGPGMPVDLMKSGQRGVAPLQFFALEEEEAERAAAEEIRQAPQQPAPQQEAGEHAAQERARQTRAMVDAARNEGRAEARREYDAMLAEQLAAERERVDKVCNEFRRDRGRYFASAEEQVVKLAIAVARRVLGREVASDPMHLVAIVRAALARVQDGSVTVLRVRPQDVEAWSATFANACDSSVSVTGDERMDEGECVLETGVGRVELGVQVQMAEVERGFAELTHRQGE